MAALQGFLTRRLARAVTGAHRALMLAAKLPLWAGFFILLARWGRTALVAGFAVAWAAYLFPMLYLVLRNRGKE
ncbi:MAG: hypothetical protein LBU67_03845 [Oscillospiraceae bacterium]|nr:hypothetical protein [Oscillospiraceae bacterium]